MMKKLILPLLLLFSFNIHAQTWDGGAGTTAWDDALNWDNDMIPATGDIVIINTNITITGTAPNNPARVEIVSGKTVTFALDLTIGDGTTTEHAIKIQGNATLNLGSGAGETFTINIATNKDGLQHTATGSPANLIVSSGSTLNIIQARDGMSIKNGSNTVTNNGVINITGADRDGILFKTGSYVNNGTLNIDGANQDGIDIEATFINNGILTINDANSNGINNRATGIVTNSGDITITTTGTTIDGILSLGTINNSSLGTITSTKMDDDCVELTGGTFTNHGTLNVTVEDGGSSSNNGLTVGTATAAATFINTSNNSVNADGGIGASGRAIYVYEMGVLSNTGTMTLTGGNSNTRFYNRGATTNDNGGTIDMTDGRISANKGTLTNNGLIKSSTATSGVFTGSNGTATNNGYYKNATTVVNFSSGSGTITDSGIDLNDPTETIIDAGGTCVVDIAETEYEYEYDDVAIGTTGSDGSLTLPDGTFTSDPAILTLEIFPSEVISLTIENFCAQALPIILSDFQVEKYSESKVLIKWSTASEINSDYIALEKSMDGKNWHEIGRKQTEIYTIEEKQYQHIDESAQSGVNYFRLRLVDLDGYFEYSKIKNITIGKTLKSDVNIYPSILSEGDFLNIDLSNIDDRNVKIVAYDLSGKLYNFGTYTGGQEVMIEIDNLLPSLYIIKTSADSYVQSQRVVVF